MQSSFIFLRICLLRIHAYFFVFFLSPSYPCVFLRKFLSPAYSCVFPWRFLSPAYSRVFLRILFVSCVFMCISSYSFYLPRIHAYFFVYFCLLRIHAYFLEDFCLPRIHAYFFINFFIVLSSYIVSSVCFSAFCHCLFRGRRVTGLLSLLILFLYSNMTSNSTAGGAHPCSWVVGV